MKTYIKFLINLSEKSITVYSLSHLKQVNLIIFSVLSLNDFEI